MVVVMIALLGLSQYTSLANHQGRLLPMEETKNLCVQISIALHNRVREEQARAALTLNQYMTKGTIL